jgi:hypothetical protein
MKAPDVQRTRSRSSRSCKKLGHDPRRYIRDTLKRILAGEKDLNALLPENYKPDVAGGTALVASQVAA